jgi:toxin ParE1/3/4
MLKYRISEGAESDLKSIWRFIARDDVDAASRFVFELIDRFVLLGDNKLIGTRHDDLRESLRSITYGKYLIFYFPLTKGVEISRVLHTARDIRAIFEKDREN